ncbi:putative WRKY transcription factor 53 [Capsicum annuum]|nr:putative WRKY transcription factor 53 [Capsicum annuum]
MEHTKQLRTYLSSVSSTSESTPNLLLQKILSSYEQSLLILKRTGSTGGANKPPPASDNRSHRGDDKKRSFKDHPELIDIPKKRKSQPRWTQQVNVRTESGFEGPLDDGYSWRKYGQKDILGAYYPRSYYRCRYWLLRGCAATKQVQRSNDDPTISEITYKDTHTCREVTNSALQPKSPEKQANHQGYSPSFASPTATESNYLSVSGSQMNSFGRVHNSNHSKSYLSNIGIIQNLYHSDSDRTYTLSANTSTTSSSIEGMDVQWAEFRQVKVG